MKKSSMIMVSVVFAATIGSMLGASAGHCGSGADRGHDPFGSCENGTPGHVECGSGPTAQGITLTPFASSGNGVEACAADSSPLPIAGRAGVWVHDGAVTVFADGDDVTNGGDASGWDRVDVDADAESCKVHVRRGSAGQWANDPIEPGQTSSTAETDQCVA